jgi:hypothetical protein
VDDGIDLLSDPFRLFAREPPGQVIEGGPADQRFVKASSRLWVSVHFELGDGHFGR